MNALSPLMLQLASKADCIIEDAAGNTYLGYADVANANRDEPLEEQFIWRIERYSESEVATSKYTRLEYPEGKSLFMFAISKFDSYEYAYRI